MKRVGERGEGKWKRISWDEAATEVAEKVFDVMTDPNRGPDKLMVHAGTGLLTEGRRGAPLRFSTQLGAVRIYPSSYLGDMFSGAAIAYGEGNVGGTYDFMYNVDTSIFWGGNVMLVVHMTLCTMLIHQFSGVVTHQSLVFLMLTLYGKVNITVLKSLL